MVRTVIAGVGAVFLILAIVAVVRAVRKHTEPSDPEGTTRRQFLNRGMLAAAGLAGAGIGSALLAFVWPSRASGFGSVVDAGDAQQIRGFFSSDGMPLFVPDAKAYLAPYPASAIPAGRRTYDERLHQGMDAGVVALFQTCPHLGCRVPFCPSSQWFECPCHASKYNRVGEKRGGPAPRGMDRFPVEVAGGRVLIDTSQRIVGPEPGVDTTGQEAEGPHCVNDP